MVLVAGCHVGASAQLGNIVNRVKWQTRSQLENSAVNAANKAGRSAVDGVKKKAKDVKKDKAEATSWTYGDHTYTMKGNLTAEKYRKDAFGEVTFTNVPSNYDEFEAVYSEFLGRTAYGTAAMIPMAMEIYARNREEGKKCFNLLCYSTNVNPVVSRLRDKFGAEPNDNYGERYLPAAVLKGATPQNGYTPQKPYTVEMWASVNKHQELQISGSGAVMYIYIIGGGWDTEQRQVEIILEPGKEQYQVFNCPSLYSGCKQIRGEWPGLE